MTSGTTMFPLRAISHRRVSPGVTAISLGWARNWNNMWCTAPDTNAPNSAARTGCTTSRTPTSVHCSNTARAPRGMNWASASTGPSTPHSRGWPATSTSARPGSTHRWSTAPVRTSAPHTSTRSTSTPGSGVVSQWPMMAPIPAAVRTSSAACVISRPATRCVPRSTWTPCGSIVMFRPGSRALVSACGSTTRSATSIASA